MNTISNKAPLLKERGWGEVDTELNSLIELSGLHDSRIANLCGISNVYFSQIKTGERSAHKTRARIKTFLIKYIKHFARLAA